MSPALNTARLTCLSTTDIAQTKDLPVTGGSAADINGSPENLERLIFFPVQKELTKKNTLIPWQPNQRLKFSFVLTNLLQLQPNIIVQQNTP